MSVGFKTLLTWIGAVLVQNVVFVLLTPEPVTNLILYSNANDFESILFIGQVMLMRLFVPSLLAGLVFGLFSNVFGLILEYIFL